MVINKHYQNRKEQEKIKQLFQKNKDFPSASLLQFFEPAYYHKLEQEIKSLKYQHQKNLLTHSYHKAVPNPKIISLLNSREILTFMEFLTHKKIKKINAAIYSFSWKDYLLLHDSKTEQPGIDFIIDFTSEWDDHWGGNIIYVNGKGDYFSLPITANSVHIINRKAGTQKFLKYINHHAINKQRHLILGTIDC